MQQLGFSIILFPIDQPCLFKGDLGGFQPKPEQLTHDWLLTEPYWVTSCPDDTYVLMSRG
jgi:hypothetical protein